MREINDHMKHVIGIEPKRKKNYTKALTWISIAIVIIVLWITAYSLMF